MTGLGFGKVGVLAGGPSSEREISLRSGNAVYDALIKDGIDAIFLDVKDDIYDIINNNKIDIAFIALHGRFGEDGTVQKILGAAGIPYTGSGAEASGFALDKIVSKEIFNRKGLPVPKGVVFEKSGYNPEDCYRLGFPMVVKPHLEGSSIGLSIVRERGSLKEAVEKAFAFGGRILVEEYIDGRELTVGILDDEPLPVIEIVTRQGVYDYTAKYSDPDTRYLVPAPLEDAVSSRARELGRSAHKALGCRSFSRVDMMLDKSGNIFLLEVNTIPGMTERSLLPKAAGAAGLSFSRLCVKLIENAMKASR
ncbi:MAG: D-alanine--D-alanine ligase [Candidatus Omnitrophota bacterium]